MSRLSSFIDSSTLVIMPSRMEGFGLVALEAALRGRPVVATRIEGLSDVVIDGETGVLVPPEDTDALTEAVINLLSREDRRASLGRRARERALERFRWEDQVTAYDLLYRELAPFSD